MLFNNSKSIISVTLCLAIGFMANSVIAREIPTEPMNAVANECVPNCISYLPMALKPAGPLAAKIEINQVLGQQSDRYVAGKDTAIVVYLQNGPVTVNAAQQSVEIKRDGNTIATLAPQAADQPTSVLVFLCPNRAACDDWRAGNYTFDVMVDGNLASLSNIQFQPRKLLRILAVPLRTNYEGSIEDVLSEDWKTAGSFIQQVYPVDPNSFKWILGPMLDVSIFDITTNNGRKRVWEAVRDLQPKECARNTSGPNCFEKIIGFVPRQIPLASGGVLNGYTWGNPANIVGIFSGFRRTVAHEVGHTFGLGDEYNGLGASYRCDINPTPPEYVGKDWYDRQNTSFSCSDPSVQGFEAGNSTGVRIVSGQAHPLDLRERGLINNDLGNFMGNYSDDSKTWISPAAWRRIFDQSTPDASRRSAVTSPYRVVEVSGFINLSGNVTLEPWYSFTSTETIVPVSSTYTIKAVNALSQTLISQGLELEFNLVHESIDDAPFHEVVAFPSNTAAFKIYKGNTLLAIVPVSAHAPVVNITAPTTGLTLNNTFDITWTANDADGDKLTSEVEYNHSGNEKDWITLATGLTTTHWVQNFATLPGGSGKSQIRVTVTDGVNATSVSSALFNVPARAPEVFIVDPSASASYAKNTSVTLEGYAYDYQDGDIESDTALVWRSNLLSSPIGTGTFIVTQLPVGQHIISLSATNSLNITGVTTRTVTIKP